VAYPWHAHDFLSPSVVLGSPGKTPEGQQLLYLFEDYALDTGRRELRRSDALLSVEPKVFDLLVHLIENRERVISKDDLLAAVWGRRPPAEAMLVHASGSRCAGISRAKPWARQSVPYAPDRMEHFVEGMRKAGVPQ
jgi:hypothetical protein